MPQSPNVNVLYLTPWYPHRYDAMSGLFVRKHAVAATRAGASVTVLYAFRDKHVSHCEIVEQHTDGVREIYVYYRGSELFALLRGFRHITRTAPMPDVVQLNVITKNALLALYLKALHGIPYIIVEHWSGYQPANNTYRGFFHKRMAELSVSHAHAVLPVSNALAQDMQRQGLTSDKYGIINNVVDGFFFLPHDTTPHDKTRILHISCFDDKAKNLCGMLRAVNAVSRIRNDFELLIVGTGIDFEHVKNYSDSLDWQGNAPTFTGELTPAQVAEQFRCADFFLMFSNYENAPVVISESLASGVPVVSSNVGGIADMVTSECGILVPPGDEKSLAEAVTAMLDNYRTYDPQAIRSHGMQYSFSAVGNTLVEFYKRTVRG